MKESDDDDDAGDDDDDDDDDDGLIVWDNSSVTKDQSLTLILQDLAGLSHVLKAQKNGEKSYTSWAAGITPEI